MNTTISLWCGTKQPSWDRLHEVFSAWSHSKPGAVHSQWEHNQHSNRENSFDMICLATATKISYVSMENIVLSLYVLLSLGGAGRQSTYSPSFSFIHSSFNQRHSFLSVLSNFWEMCLSAKMSIRHFTFLCTKLTHESFCCCCRVSVPQRKDWPAYIRQWCKGFIVALLLWPVLK